MISACNWATVAGTRPTCPRQRHRPGQYTQSWRVQWPRSPGHTQQCTGHLFPLFRRHNWTRHWRQWADDSGAGWRRSDPFRCIHPCGNSSGTRNRVCDRDCTGNTRPCQAPRSALHYSDTLVAVDIPVFSDIVINSHFCIYPNLVKFDVRPIHSNLILTRVDLAVLRALLQFALVWIRAVTRPAG